MSGAAPFAASVDPLRDCGLRPRLAAAIAAAKLLGRENGQELRL